MSELLPCPFCGSSNVAMTLSTAYWVCCLECEADGPPHEDAEAEAVAAWNRRAAATARTEARREALEEAAKVAETPAIWRPHPEIPDCHRIASAIRALKGEG